jgi:translocator protein
MRIADEVTPKRALMAFLILTLAVGAAASLVTEPNIPGWYGALAKPSFNPPNWLFAPVWTLLYVLMGIAAWRVWRKTSASSAEMLLWFAQLALNFGWSFVFFGAHAIGTALVEILLLLALVIVTAIAFWRVDRIAAVLLLPYIGWVGFASLLNYEIWRLNS